MSGTLIYDDEKSAPATQPEATAQLQKRGMDPTDKQQRRRERIVAAMEADPPAVRYAAPPTQDDDDGPIEFTGILFGVVLTSGVIIGTAFTIIIKALFS